MIGSSVCAFVVVVSGFNFILFHSRMLLRLSVVLILCLLIGD